MDVNTHPVRDPQTSPWTKHSSLHRHFHHRHSRRIKETLVLDIFFFTCKHSRMKTSHQFWLSGSSPTQILGVSIVPSPPSPDSSPRLQTTSNRLVYGVSLKLYCDRSVSLLRNDQSGRPPVSLWHVSSSLVALTVNMYFHPKIFQRRQVLLLKNPRTGTPKPPPSVLPHRPHHVNKGFQTTIYRLSKFSSFPHPLQKPTCQTLPVSSSFHATFAFFRVDSEAWENSTERTASRGLNTEKHWRQKRNC